MSASFSYFYWCPIFVAWMAGIYHQHFIYPTNWQKEYKFMFRVLIYSEIASCFLSFLFFPDDGGGCGTIAFARLILYFWIFLIFPFFYTAVRTATKIFPEKYQPRAHLFVWVLVLGASTSWVLMKSIEH